MRRDVFSAALSAALLLAAPALAQDELGMTVTGDEASELGLFIAEWLDTGRSQLPAPALQDETLEAVDPLILRRQREIRRATAPADSAPR